MNPLAGPILQQLLAKLDVFHLLQVLSGADQPDSSELHHISALHRLLSAPIGGDMVWGKITEFLESKQFDHMALGYVTEGLSKYSIDMPVESLRDAKPAVERLLEAIITNPDIPRVAAITQCPSCNFVYGA